jgi:hypothetical protein
MTSQYRHRRTSSPATPFNNPLEPGEIAVNTANRQIAVGDAAAGTTGTPKPLLAIRYFDTAAQYVVNEFVVNGTALYRSNKATGPGPFTAADWQMMVGTIDPQYVAKAGDVMTGPLSLPAAAPTVGAHATNKTYVDNLVALKSSVIVSDVKPSPDPIDSTLWYCTLDGQLYIRYNDGNSTAWVIAAPQPDSSNYVNLIGSSAVRYDVAQTLTAPQQTQARTNVFAAPFDALAFSGMQINGSFDVSQEKGVDAGTAAGFACDGWIYAKSGTMVGYAGAYNVTVFPGFPRGFGSGISTGQPTLGAGDFVAVTHNIEGYRTARLAWGTPSAQPITLAFWVRAHRPGTYTGVIRNSDHSRTYAFGYTVNAADTVEYKTITIPGCADGVWNTTNLEGISVTFTQACGTTFTAPSFNSWLTTNYVGGPGQVNGAAATTDNLYLAGVVVLPGVEAPSAARSPYIMRPYDQELLTCQRYYEKTYASSDPPGKAYGNNPGGGAISAVVYATNSYATLGAWYFKVVKRGNPTCTLYSPWTGASGVIRAQIANADIAAFSSSYNEKHMVISVNAVSVGSGDYLYGHAVADARL